MKNSESVICVETKNTRTVVVKVARNVRPRDIVMTQEYAPSRASVDPIRGTLTGRSPRARRG